MSEKIRYNRASIMMPSGGSVKAEVNASKKASARLRCSGSSSKNVSNTELSKSNIRSLGAIVGGILHYMGKKKDFEFTLELQEAEKRTMDRLFLTCPDFPPGTEYELFAGDIARDSHVIEYYCRLSSATIPQLVSLIANEGITREEFIKEYPDLAISFAIILTLRMSGVRIPSLYNCPFYVIEWYFRGVAGFGRDNVVRSFRLFPGLQDLVKEQGIASIKA